MLDQNLAELLPLIFGSHAKRTKGKDLFSIAVFVLKPRLGIHYVADDLAVFFKHEGKLGDKIGMISHRVNKIMFVRAGLVNVPKCLAGEFFYCSVIFLCF